MGVLFADGHPFPGDPVIYDGELSGTFKGIVHDHGGEPLAQVDFGGGSVAALDPGKVALDHAEIDRRWTNEPDLYGEEDW